MIKYAKQKYLSETIDLVDHWGLNLLILVISWLDGDLNNFMHQSNKRIKFAAWMNSHWPSDTLSWTVKWTLRFWEHSTGKSATKFQIGFGPEPEKNCSIHIIGTFPHLHCKIFSIPKHSLHCYDSVSFFWTQF